VAVDLAYVTPEVLRWARESTGYSLKEAARKIGVHAWRLELAEQGDDLLTLRQAEKAAETYERPLAALFLPEPPNEEPQEQQFRRLPGAPNPPWPPEMQLLVRRIRDRQDAALELYDALEEPPLWPDSARSLVAVNREQLPAKAREALGVSLGEQESWPDGYAALRAWRDAVERLGVLVMQSGTLPVNALRGFASIDGQVPAILVNTKDDPRARAFTIVHELGHLVLAVNGEPVGPHSEPWCNEFAGEVLMPPRRLEEVYRTTAGRKTLLERVDDVARMFTVTPLAAAVRIARAGLAPNDSINAAIGHIRGRGHATQSRSAGGDYYINQIAGLGPGYIRLVFDALDSQAVTYPTASALLGGVKVNNFDKLREQLRRRAELE
jgi:Zn-dependent peptidase ImmA (M78 family)/transcriptional regulator with XRE-family HTH domain